MVETRVEEGPHWCGKRRKPTKVEKHFTRNANSIRAAHPTGVFPSHSHWTVEFAHSLVVVSRGFLYVGMEVEKEVQYSVER